MTYFLFFTSWVLSNYAPTLTKRSWWYFIAGESPAEVCQWTDLFTPVNFIVFTQIFPCLLRSYTSSWFSSRGSKGIHWSYSLFICINLLCLTAFYSDSWSWWYFHLKAPIVKDGVKSLAFAFGVFIQLIWVIFSTFCSVIWESQSQFSAALSW